MVTVFISTCHKQHPPNSSVQTSVEVFQLTLWLLPCPNCTELSQPIHIQQVYFLRTRHPILLSAHLLSPRKLTSSTFVLCLQFKPSSKSNSEHSSPPISQPPHHPPFQSTWEPSFLFSSNSKCWYKVQWARNNENWECFFQCTANTHENIQCHPCMQFQYLSSEQTLTFAFAWS